MRTLQEVRDRCVIDELGHWIWKGAYQPGSNSPAGYGPNYSKDPTGNTMSRQSIPRIVWQLKNQMAVRKGYRTFNKCRVVGCVNPDCIKMGNGKDFGKAIADSGVLKGVVKRQIANRKINAKRSKLTKEQIAELMNSTESTRSLAVKHGVSEFVIYRARKGFHTSYQPIAGVFTGLLDRPANSMWSERA